jgi:hypothetical protein
MREALHKVEAFDGNLVMLDATEDLPPAVAASRRGSSWRSPTSGSWRRWSARRCGA